MSVTRSYTKLKVNGIKGTKIAYVNFRSWISAFHLYSDGVLGNQGQAVCRIFNRNAVSLENITSHFYHSYGMKIMTCEALLSN